MRRYRIIILAVLLLVLLTLPATASAQIPEPGDWVDDLSQDINFAIDGLWYDILLLHSQAQW
jgi:hypothetical protein